MTSREQFEKWANTYGFVISRDEDIAWEAWQASRAWMPIESAPLNEMILLRNKDKRIAFATLHNRNTPENIIEWQYLPE